MAAWVDALPGVNHNYEREHRFNLWFVITGPRIPRCMHGWTAWNAMRHRSRHAAPADAQRSATSTSASRGLAGAE